MVAVLKDVRLRDLRHSHASQAVLQGVPLPVVSKLLSHRQLSTTLRYAHVADQEVEAAAPRLCMKSKSEYGSTILSHA